MNGQESIVDTRDNRIYKTLTIGNQIWFSENLKFKTKHSLCYKRRGKNCEHFGRLYRYDELEGICPEGFRVPNIEDWNKLKSNFQDDDIIPLMEAIDLKGVGYQFAKRTFIGTGNSTSIWINQMNKYAEYFHVHLHVNRAIYFEKTDFKTNEVFHAHPIEGIKHRKFSVRCMKNKNNE